MRLAKFPLVVVCGAVSLVIAFIIGASSVALAQTDPVYGTWKLNPAKSKFTPGPAYRSQTITYASVPNGIKATVDGVDGNGNKIAYTYTAYFDGKDVRETGVGMPNGMPEASWAYDGWPGVPTGNGAPYGS